MQRSEQINLIEKYDSQIQQAIKEFSEFNEVLNKAEIEKKVFILKLAEILKNNFLETGTFDMMKTSIASIIISIINNNNISITESYIFRILKPLGYSNIKSKPKTIDEVKQAQNELKNLNSSVIYCNNVLKDLSAYKKDLSNKLLDCNNDLVTYHFTEEELNRLKDQTIQIYNKVIQDINNRKLVIQQQQQQQQQQTEIKKPANVPQDGNNVPDPEDEVEKDYPEEDQEEEAEAEIDDEIPEHKDTLTSEILYNKIDSPREKLPFVNHMANKIKEIEQELKISSKNFRKYHNILLKYPEYDPKIHKQYTESFDQFLEFVKGINMFIKPYINLKYRRDAIGWIELLEISEQYTEGAACSRSKVPAKYYDKKGKLVETQRKLTKEHITENLPYAKKLKKMIQNTSKMFWTLNQHYLRNLQPYTNGFTAKYHEKMSNSS